MKPLPHREIFRFYLPLVLTSQMMTLSGPLINVAVGRSADPKVEFAGYWLGFTILMFIESPCFIIQQAAATLLQGHQSMRRLFAGATILGLAATAFSVFIAVTPVGDFLFTHLVTTTPRAAAVAKETLLLLSPIPIIIAIRGVANALALKEKKTGLIARATVTRIVVLAGAVGVAVGLHTSSGAAAGSIALDAGLIIETLFILHGTKFIRRRIHDEKATGENRFLSFREILRVSAPLVISAYVWTAIRPVINAILGRLPDPELAQGGFGVVIPILLLTCSPLWALQNVTLILPENHHDLRRVIRFSAWATVFFAALVALLLWTPIRGGLLHGAFSLDAEMERVVAPALFLIVLEPLFLATRSTSQGLLIRARRTGVFTGVSLSKIVLLTVVGMWFVSRWPALNGVLLGTTLFISGELFDGVFYSLRARSLLLGGVLFPKIESRGQGSA